MPVWATLAETWSPSFSNKAPQATGRPLGSSLEHRPYFTTLLIIELCAIIKNPVTVQKESKIILIVNFTKTAAWTKYMYPKQHDYELNPERL